MKALLAVFDKDLAYITSRNLVKRGFEVLETTELDGIPLYMGVKNAELLVLDRSIPRGDDGLEWVAANHADLADANVLILLLSPSRPSDAERDQEHTLDNFFILPRPSASIRSQESFVRRVERALGMAGRSLPTPPAPSAPRSRNGSGRPGRRVGLLEYHPSPVLEHGSLVDRPFIEVFCDAALQGVSGRLLVRHGAVIKKVYLLGGFPFYVESNHPDEALDDQVIREGWLEERDHDLFEDQVARGQHSVGTILTQNDLITPTSLHALLTANFSQKILSLFTWEEGEFSFEANDEFGQQDYSFCLSPARIILDALIHHVSDETVERCLMISTKLRPYLRDSDLWEDEELPLTDVEFGIIRYLRARLPVQEILDQSGEPEWLVSRLLTGFYLLGMIGFEPTPIPKERRVVEQRTRPQRKVRSRLPTASPPPHDIEIEYERLSRVDYLALLGVDRSCDQEAIHRAFRMKIRPYHYDVLTKLPPEVRLKGEEIVKIVTEAYLTVVTEGHQDLYLADLEDPTLSLEDAARRARMRREGVQNSPIPTSPVSNWAMSPPPSMSSQDREPASPPRMTAKPSAQETRSAAEPKRRSSRFPITDLDRLLHEAKVALFVRDPEKAVGIVEDALDHHPDDPRLLAWYAWALFCESPDGRATRAQTNLEASMQADPSLPDAHLLLARIAEYQDDHEGASKHYRVVSFASSSSAAFRKEAEAFENRALDTWRRSSTIDRQNHSSEEAEVLLRGWLRSDSRAGRP